jgi:hypothetical protein
MRRAFTGGAVALAGVVFIVVTFSQNLFRVGTDFEEMITDFRPALTDESIATYTADVQGLGAMAEEFGGAMVPAMSLALNMQPADFQAFIASEFPAVSQGVQALPDISSTFGSLIGTLGDQQGNFMSADEIPTEDFVAQTVPWGFLVVGIISILVGAAIIWWRPRFGSGAAVVLGLLIVVGSFVLSLPGKAADADDLNDALKPVYTEDTVTGAAQALGVVGAMGQELQAGMLPAMAQQLGMSQEELGAFLADGFPTIAQGLQTMPQQMDRFEALVTTFNTNLENYETLKPVAFTPIIWILIGGGFAIAIAGVLGLLGPRKDEATA